MKLSTDDIYLVSDTHFFHGNIIKYSNRPFNIPDQYDEKGVLLPDIELMNETLVLNWNSRIGPQTNVFFLGDLSFARPELTKTILDRLNGNIFLIKGNHDWNIKSLSKYFVWEKDLTTILVPDDDIKGGYRPVVLCHYPLLSWDRMRYGAFHCHGHCHGSLSFDPNVYRLDVGVDVHNYFPISYNEIKAKFNLKSDK
jgi:calcineurin-like phosphoesterase family protein